MAETCLDGGARAPRARRALLFGPPKVLFFGSPAALGRAQEAILRGSVRIDIFCTGFFALGWGVLGVISVIFLIPSCFTRVFASSRGLRGDIPRKTRVIWSLFFATCLKKMGLCANSLVNYE
jgi:hypothetical protein